MSALLEIIFGIIIAGLIIVSIMHMNAMYVETNSKNSQSYNQQLFADIFTLKLAEDINTMGYNITDFYNCVIVADSLRLEFTRDLNEDLIPDTVRIYTRTFPIDPTINPMDFQIVRDTSGVLFDYDLTGLVGFKFSYLDKNGATTTTLNQIKSIVFDYTIAGAEPVDMTMLNELSRYPVTSGRKIVSPKNIYDW